MEKLEELIAALEAATGPSRELDCAIAVAVAGYYEIPPKWEGGPIGYGYVEDDGKRYVEPGHGGDQLVRRYTASIDAAISLIGEDEFEMTNLYGVARVTVHNQGDFGPSYGSSECNSLPIAICIAALRAKLSQEKNNADK